MDTKQEATLTRDDVARILKVHKNTVIALELNGEIPLPKRIGRSVRWSAEEFYAWLNGEAKEAGG